MAECMCISHLTPESITTRNVRTFHWCSVHQKFLRVFRTETRQLCDFSELHFTRVPPLNTKRFFVLPPRGHSAEPWSNKGTMLFSHRARRARFCPRNVRPTKRRRRRRLWSTLSPQKLHFVFVKRHFIPGSKKFVVSSTFNRVTERTTPQEREVVLYMSIDCWLNFLKENQPRVFLSVSRQRTTEVRSRFSTTETS